MKPILLLILFGIFNISFAQPFGIRQDKKAHFVNRIDNPLTIFGKIKDSYVVATNNGKIENVGKNMYSLRPDKIGNLQITIADKSGKLLYKENFNVKDIKFDVDFYGLKSGVQDVNIFLNHNHLQLLSNDLISLDFYWQWNFEIIHIKQNEKYEITDFDKSRSFIQLKDKLKPLERGDILIFKNIKIYLQEIEYSIPDKVVYVNQDY